MDSFSSDARTLSESGEHLLMGNGGQVPLQQLLPIVPQFLDEIKRIEDGEENIPFAEHLVQVMLADLIAVVGDGHSAFLPGAGQLMVLPFPVQKIQLHHQVRIRLTVQAVNATLTEKRKPGDGEGDGVGDAGFAAAVAAGYDGGIAKGQMRRLLIALEPG